MAKGRKRNPNLKSVARQSSMRLLAAAALKRGRWSIGDRKQFDRAFNALQRLAGKKLVMRRRQLVVEARA